MAQYTRNKSEAVPPTAYVVLKKFLGDKVTVIDDTGMGLLKIDRDAHPQLDVLSKFKDSGYIRFGCMWQATDELEPYLDNIPLAFLAFNAKNEDTHVAFDKGLVLRPVFSEGKIVQLGVSQNLEWEKFLLTKRNFTCKDFYVEKPPDMVAKEFNACTGTTLG